MAANQHDRIVEQALRDAQNFLWANLPSTHNLSADRTVACLRAIMGRPEVGEALERGNDDVLGMALRSVKRVLVDKAQPSRATINRVWAILDEPEFNRAFGTQQSPINLRRKRPPAR